MAITTQPLAPAPQSTLRVVPANLRSARGQYAGSCLVFAGETFLRGFPTVAAAKRFIAAQSKVVA
jgi:hypothetical protein